MNKWPITVAGIAGAATILIAVVCLSGCANLGYYWQSVTGHMAVVNAAKPISEWLDDAKTPDATKKRLELSQRIRSFASSKLKLPDNPSYRRYADLQRRAVVTNVVAAPAYSLTLKTWCFPVAGCVGYRGYYAEADAKLEAAALEAQGLEVGVYGVPAYSTLGYMNWAGGDPLLSTFINYPEGELARLIFHELAHQVLYVKDDTMFNESFATAVEKMGSRLWLEQHGLDASRKEYAEFDARRTQFRALTLRTRARLAVAYEDNKSGKPQKLDEAMLAPSARPLEKQKIMSMMRDEYEQLKSNWGGYSGYDNWIANANNASLGAQASYDELVPQFEALFAVHGKDWQKFYEACKLLVPLPKDARRKALAEQSGLALR